MNQIILRMVVASATGILPNLGLAQNMAPELTYTSGLNGEQVNEIAIWTTQPAEDLKQAIDEILGTDMAPFMKGSMGRDIVAAVRSQPVSDQWFARQCDFSEEQLASMALLREGYVLHLDAMRSE